MMEAADGTTDPQAVQRAAEARDCAPAVAWGEAVDGAALNCVDIVPHAAAIEIAADQTEATLTGSLIRLWERLGVPQRVQFDNGKPFLLGSASLGEIVRVSLHQRATPVFIPQGRALAQRDLRAVQRHLRQALLSLRALR